MARRVILTFQSPTGGYLLIEEHASLAVFILSAGAIDETITKHVIVDTSVAANYIRCWARETFHSVLCRCVTFSWDSGIR
ncbi:hypothetical protein OUZ56_031028 [Daphnia magna]|uniref:Uncharacterized protein n=1 Tax=Daphnia magna TaxID=35525 RepID=A0ABQ9ZT17_9CRUS|nr:hypothetical protein OUZ56_031028 [Daphnia magna]